MDTIAALATAPGIAGLAVIRLSGTDSIEIAAKIFHSKENLKESKSHTIHYGRIMDEGKVVDTVTVSIFRQPHSYTGENVVEIACHGSELVYNSIIELLIKNNARPATAGEFTRRAFLNGKLDLTQVEAVADLIHSSSRIGALTSARQLEGGFTQRLSALRQSLIDCSSLLVLELDFAEEDLEFVSRNDLMSKIENVRRVCLELASEAQSAEIVRSGYFVAIAGFPNSGKSTLFNTLLKRERAIVSPTAGTTRDYLEETIYLNGMKIHLVDTAGIRQSNDEIEIEGLRLGEQVLNRSNMILILNDASISLDNSDSLQDRIEERYPDKKVIVVQNKMDLLHNAVDGRCLISAKKGDGVRNLLDVIYAEAELSTERVNDVLINQRQAILLKSVAACLQNVRNGIEQNYDSVLIAIDIDAAVRNIGEITGEVWSEEVLNNIFSNFCIGK